MRVRIRFHGVFAESAGSKEMILFLDTDKANLNTVIEELFRKLDKRSRRIRERFYSKDRARIIILVNGRNAIYTGWLDTPIKDGDLLDIIPPLAGGMSTVF